jgi:Cu/Zn superoxide dismutase
MTVGMSCRRKERMMKSTAILVALVAALSMASAAYAQELKFEAELSGAAERPTPVVTEGVGEAKFESDGTSVEYELKWDDLTTPAFAAHIHCGGPEESGPVGVTLFASAMGTEGEVQGTFTSPDPGNRCGWEDLDDVLDAMAAGDAYVNVHTQLHPGGEIRGQIAAD